MAHDVFISYSNYDKAVADAACAILENRGIRCWMAPRDVTPGMDWSAEIIDAIEASRVMVLIYSASANQSPQIKREVERAVSKGLPILPFRIEELRQASMSIKRDGSYEMRIAVRDGGTITASGGQYQIINAAHIPIQGTYSAVGPSAMSMTGPLGTGVWARTGGSSTQRFPLAGQWNIAFTMDGAPWRMNFDIGQNGAYRLVSETDDAGQIVAGGGSYTMTSTSGKVINGTYQVLNANSVATQGPAGPAVWQRR